MFIFCVYCVSSSLCDKMTTVCDLETSKKRRPRPYLGCSTTEETQLIQGGPKVGIQYIQSEA